MTAQEILSTITPDNMETFARAVLMLSPESQEQFFAMLHEVGATPEEVKTLQKCVYLYKMHTNQRYYNTIKSAVGEALAKEWGIAK